jgi:putative oxidoreductase
MKTILNNKYFLFAIRILLGTVFIYAAISKASDAEGFARAIANYKLLPIFLINILALILPWVELCAGILLIFGVSVKENSMILGGLLVVFIVAILISLARGLNIDCGCFGTVGGTKVGIQKILENIGLLLSAIILIKFESNSFTLFKQN